MKSSSAVADAFSSSCHFISFPSSSHTTPAILGEVDSFASPASYFGLIDEINDNLLIISLKIFDGNRIWEGILGIENKPHSRRHETNNEYFQLMKDAILHIDNQKYEYSFQLSSPSGAIPSSSSHGRYSSSSQHHTNDHEILTFVIKEKLEGMSSLILRYDYLLYTTNSSQSLVSFYQSIYQLLSHKDEAIISLKSEIESNRVALDTLSQQYIQMTIKKEQYQKDFFTKFCLIVNSKKDEIKRLCGEVNHYKEQIELYKTQLQTYQEQQQQQQQRYSVNTVEVPTISTDSRPKAKRAPSKKRINPPKYTKASATQNMESKPYLSDEEMSNNEEAEFDGPHSSGSGRGTQSTFEGDSTEIISSNRIETRQRGKVGIKKSSAESSSMDSSQSRILPPRGVEVGGNQELDRILSQQSPIDSLSSSQPMTRLRASNSQIVIPDIKEEYPESTRKKTSSRTAQTYPTTQIDTQVQPLPVDAHSSFGAPPPPVIPSTEATVAVSSSQTSRKTKTRVRQMFGSSSDEEEDPKQQDKKIAKKLRGNKAVSDVNDVLNYM